MRNAKWLAVLSTAAILASCKKEDKMKELNIDYPAAYVVNGEDATLSVIKLSDNTVAETIELMGQNNTNMIMWPHHVYHHNGSNGHHLAVGVPGMDMSLGHTGGMPHGGKIAIVDAVKGTISKVVDLPKMNHNAVYSPDGKEIWTSQMETSGKVLVYDAGSFTLKNTIAVGEDPAEVTFSNDGSKAYVCNGGSNTVMVINPLTKAVVTTINVGTNPVGAWPSSIGKMFVDNEDGQTITVIDVNTNMVDGTINLGFKPGFAAYHSGRSELWVSNATNGKIVYYQDMGGGFWMKHGEFSAGADTHVIAFYGDKAYVTNQGANTVSVFNVLTHNKIKDIPVGKKPNGIAFKL